MTDIDIRVSGPIFDGRAEAALHRLPGEIVDELAAQGYSEWMERLNASIKHPTPYYETQITTSKHGNSALIHDRGVVYGPWLEGTGSRNRTTRFKGYASRRRAVQALQAKAPGLVQHVVARVVREMGG